jgi:hypothetical protein
MFLMSWVMALITFVVVITLYLYVSYRKPGMLANIPNEFNFSGLLHSVAGLLSFEILKRPTTFICKD